MINPWRLVFSSAAASVLGATAGAHNAPPSAEPAPDAVQAPKARAALLAERPVLVPGKTATFGLHFTIQPEWHIYSNAISDSGGPPSAEWTLPDGFKVQPTLWPVPRRYLSPGDLIDHVYEREAMLLVPVAVPADARPGSTVTIAADLTWMVCKDICLIERQTVSIELPVATEDSAQIVPDPKFPAARSKLPKPVTLGEGSDGEKAGIAAAWSGAALKIQVKGAKELTFYPNAEAAAPLNMIADCTAKADTLTIRFDPTGPGNPAKSAPVRGVLQIKRPTLGAPETGEEFYEFSFPRAAGH